MTCALRTAGVGRVHCVPEFCARSSGDDLRYRGPVLKSESRYRIGSTLRTSSAEQRQWPSFTSADRAGEAPNRVWLVG